MAGRSRQAGHMNQINADKAGTDTPDRVAFSMDEITLRWKVSKGWLYEQIKSGHVRSVKLGGRRFIAAAEEERLFGAAR